MYDVAAERRSMMKMMYIGTFHLFALISFHKDLQLRLVDAGVSYFIH